MMKLRDRLTLTFTLVTAIALLASFVVTYFLVERDEMRDLDRALLVQAEHAASIAVQRGIDDPKMLEGAGEAIDPPSLTVRYAALYERSGALVRTTKSFWNAPPTLDALARPGDAKVTAGLDFMVGGSQVRGVALPVFDRYVLVFALPRANVTDDLRYLVRVFSGLFVASTLITWFVARWLGRELSRDVDALGGVAERVAKGDLGARVGSMKGGTVETKLLAERLDEMISRLSELVTSQRVFITSAAHELRSPLTSLRGELQLALRRERTSDDYKETIERALSDAEALVTLADDLLALAHVDDPSREKSSSLDAVLEDARRMSRGNAEARGVKLVVAEDGWDAAVSCPQKDGARALRNLIDNAIAHSPEGSEVSVAVETAGDVAKIAVVDRGPGVQKEDEAHIFAPFFRGQAERAGETTGAGLGLSLAREIARAHGGDVSLDRSYGGGARFVLSLPLAS